MPESCGEIVQELLQECTAQAEAPPKAGGKPDMYVGMFALALASGLSRAPRKAQHAFEDAISRNRLHKPFPASVAFHSALRLFQMQRMREVNYPYENQEQWDEELRTLLSNPAQLNHMTELMQIWDVGSDVETRAAGPKLVAQTLLPERTVDADRPLKILSVGSARDHTLAMIAGDVPFPEVRMAFDGRYSKRTRAFFEERVNELLATHVELGHSTGVDLWPLRDPEWSKFLEACRYYPSELRDLEKRKRYLQLEDIRDTTPQIDHVQADFAYDPVIKDNYDIVLFSTSLYQNYPQKQRLMFENALDVLEPGGLIIVQDFCETRPPHPSNEHPLGSIKFLGPVTRPYRYMTLVYNPDKPHDGLQDFATWNNGRCERFKPGELLVRAITSA